MSRSREAHREYMRAYRARKREEAGAAKPAAQPAAAPPKSDAPPTPGRHAVAVERMLTETGLTRVVEESPLVELLKDLAAELDAGGGTRARQHYMAALRDVRRVLAAAPGAAGAAGGGTPKPPEQEVPVPEPAPEDKAVTDFASFKRAKGGAAAG